MYLTEAQLREVNAVFRELPMVTHPERDYSYHELEGGVAELRNDGNVFLGDSVLRAGSAIDEELADGTRIVRARGSKTLEITNTRGEPFAFRYEGGCWYQRHTVVGHTSPQTAVERVTAAGEDVLDGIDELFGRALDLVGLLVVGTLAMGLFAWAISQIAALFR